MGLRTSIRPGKLSEQQREEVNKQLASYLQNSAVSMTKAQYFEMCEQLGTEPIESEIPIEHEDLPQEVQEALQIYNTLQDSWDYMGGNYIGKNFSYIDSVFDIYSVAKEDRKTLYELLIQIDRIRAQEIQNKKPKK